MKTPDPRNRARAGMVVAMRTLLLTSLLVLRVVAEDREFELVWSADLPGLGAAKHLVLDENKLYCATRRGLLILDATNPASLELLAGLTLPDNGSGTGQTLAVVGTRAYVAGDNSVSLVDVSDVRSPYVIHHLSGSQIGAADIPQASSWQGDAFTIAASGDLCVLSYADGWFRLLQITPENELRLAGGINLGHGGGALVMREGYAFVATVGGGLKVVDVSNPFAPVLVTTMSNPSRLYGLASHGDRRLIAAGELGLHVLDISNPRAPQALGSLAIDGSVEHVVTHEDLAYLSVFSEGTSGPRLAIVDARDPQAMTILHRDPTTGSYDASVVRGDHLIALAYGDIRIIDVYDPEAPRPVDEHWTGLRDWNAGVALSGNVALVANGSSSLMILDLADRSKPRWIGSLNTAGWAHSPAVRGSTAFLADSSLHLDYGANRTVPGEGVVAVDISDPEAPRRLGAILAGAQVRAVAVVGETLYVARNEAGLTIVDCSDPTNLRVVGQ